MKFDFQDVAILFVLVSAAAGQDIWSVQIHVCISMHGGKLQTNVHKSVLYFCMSI
jgi:hypothetical protein